MKNIYMVQASTTYGGKNFRSAYLPYAAGLLVAYAKTKECIRNNYNFKGFIFTREDVVKAAGSMEDPFLVGFSNYIWNTEYNKALAKEIRKLYPGCIILFGGHNVPPGDDFLREFDYIDFLIHSEGEEAFAELLTELTKEKKDFSHINNLSYRTADGKTGTNPTVVLTKTDYPSPYLEGIFDDIIKNNPGMQLDAILETSRGCPNHCAYCDWGCTNSKVKFFPLDRALKEIEWFAKNKIAFLWGADANFGADKRDLIIADKLVECRQKYGYPERIRTNYAKNNHERVFEINRKFEKFGLSKEGATLSFQSLNPETLKIIGRSNMSLEKFHELMVHYRNEGVTTYSELILGLPGETYESFCRGVGSLLESGQHRLINVYNCEILPNSPLAQKDFREKYGIITANVPFLTAHSKAENEVCEMTNYVTGTASMSHEDWIRANIFACYESSLHHYGLLRSFAIYMFFEKKMRYEDFYNKVIDYCRESELTVLNSAYRFLYNFYKSVADGQPMKLYYNEIYGNITWPPEHMVLMDLSYRLDEFYEAIRPLFESFGVENDILDELFLYQKCILKRPNANHFEETFSHDWHTYFTAVISGDFSPLEKVKNTLRVDNEEDISSWPDFAVKATWFGKNGTTFNQGITCIKE